MVLGLRFCISEAGIDGGLWVREEKDAECLEQGRELVQVLVDRLFNMPSTVDKVGRLVKLPKPSLQLPREKPVCPNLWIPRGCLPIVLLPSAIFVCLWQTRIDVNCVSFAATQASTHDQMGSICANER